MDHTDTPDDLARSGIRTLDVTGSLRCRILGHRCHTVHGTCVAGNGHLVTVTHARCERPGCSYIRFRADGGYADDFDHD